MLKPGQVLVSENGEVWRWDGFTSNGKQNSSIKAVVEQLKNRRIKELLKEEGSWQKILHEANNRVLELQERKKDIAKIAVKCMIGGALASWLTATIAGILY